MPIERTVQNFENYKNYKYLYEYNLLSMKTFFTANNFSGELSFHYYV
jgi:hypothetical protein